MINRLAKSTLLCAVLCFTVGTLWGQALEQVLTSFGYPDAANPLAGLIQGTDGALYGTTSLGGTNDYGVVFKIATDGTNSTSLYSFTGVSGDGANPCAGVVQASDGALYGTTRYGGSNGNGMIFRLSTDGFNYTPLYSFPAVPFGSGGDCQAGLVQGIDGFLYGTGSLGGAYGFGIVFKLNTNGTGYTTLALTHGKTLPNGERFSGSLTHDGAYRACFALNTRLSCCSTSSLRRSGLSCWSWERNLSFCSGVRFGQSRRR